MAAQSGHSYILKTPATDATAKGSSVPADAEFSNVGGFQSNDAELAASEIDVTNKSTNQNMSLLNRAGILSFALSGSGILQDSNLHKNLQVNVGDQDLRWFQVTRDDGRSFTAKYKITSFSTSATYDGAVNFSIALMSSGTIYIKDSNGFEYNTGSNLITTFGDRVEQLTYINTGGFSSATYTQQQIPEPDARLAAFRTRVGGLTLTDTAKVTFRTNNRITISGNNSPGKYSFPFIYLLDSDFNPITSQNFPPVLQITDIAGVNITDAFVYMGNYTISGDAYRAFYYNHPVFEDASISILMQAGL